MTLLLSWNIQYGKGCDGRIDLDRIAAVARSRGAVDVLCFQEVAQNYAEMGGGAGVDQVAELCALFPGYQAHFAAGVDAAGPVGSRRRFGNLTLSRLPVLDAAAHLLPRPAEPGVLHMPRAAMVTLVETAAGPVRIASTHLEFHSERQRLAQAERLCALHHEAVANEAQPPAPGPGAYALLPRALGTLVCGDFNFELASAPYRAMLAGGFADAWPLVHGGRPHDPTCGIYDHAQWKQGAHARDFWFLSPGLAAVVTGIAVDTRTDASDHQPVWLSLTPSTLSRAA